MEEMREASLELLVGLAGPQPDDAVLDYAAGAGMAGFALAPDVRAVEVVNEQPDLLQEGTRLAGELGLVNVAFTLVDLYGLPFRDGQFSLGVCYDTFHALPKPAAALAELVRVTAPGGRLVLVAPVVDEVTDEPLNDLARLRQPEHRRHYTRDELLDICADAGLAVRAREELRRTVDLDYWLDAAAVPPPKADLIRSRFKELSVAVQAELDVVFADRLVSFSYDVLGLRLERA